MRRWMVVAAGLVAGLMPATRGLAQVGTLPERSPFVDATYRQGLSTFVGWWNAGTDPAGVSPRSAPLLGARYDWSIGSAGSLFVRQQMTLSSRNAIDPFRAPAQRALGSYAWPLSITDAGFTMQLTGQKSYRRLIPTVELGIGLLTDLKAERDVGGYSVGTNFMFSGGTGLQYVATERLRVRVDAGLFVHRFRYPDTYFALSDPVLAASAVRGGWRFNSSVTVGALWTVFR